MRTRFLNILRYLDNMDNAKLEKFACIKNYAEKKERNNLAGSILLGSTSTISLGLSLKTGVEALSLERAIKELSLERAIKELSPQNYLGNPAVPQPVSIAETSQKLYLLQDKLLDHSAFGASYFFLAMISAVWTMHCYLNFCDARILKKAYSKKLNLSA